MPLPEGDDRARSMRDPDVRNRRRRMLRCRHIAPLTAYAAKLRRRRLGEVPEFDPLDGGVEARVLFLFEKPGPMTVEDGRGRRLGSGFISRNNDDPTAEATFNFMRKAKLPRTQTVIWNVIPGWNGTRRVSAAELEKGLECLKELIAKLTKLRAVVLVGGKAARAKPYFEATGLRVINSAHPSPIVKGRYRKKWRAIPRKWAEVQQCFD